MFSKKGQEPLKWKLGGSMERTFTFLLWGTHRVLKLACDWGDQEGSVKKFLSFEKKNEIHQVENILNFEKNKTEQSGW